MNVSVIVATFGSEEWASRGREALASLELWHDAYEVSAVHRPNETLARVRNVAAEQAGGDWLCFLDADDRLEPGYLAAMQAAMRLWNLYRPHDVLANACLLAPAMRTVDEAGRPCPPFSSAQLPNRHQPMGVLNHCVIGTLVPRRLFLDVGGFGEERTLEDWALFLRCVRAGARIVDVPDAVYVATMRPGSRNTDQAAYESIRAEHERSAT